MNTPRFAVKKVENCFSHSQTYEYRLPITGEALLLLLSDWSIRKNEKLRRPVGIAEKDGVTVKTVLSSQSARVSFPNERAEASKETFERWLDEHV